MSLGASHQLDECIGNSGTLPLLGSEPKSSHARCRLPAGGVPFSVARVSPRQSEMLRSLARMNLVSTQHTTNGPRQPKQTIDVAAK
jgi:hypothetical protein